MLDLWRQRKISILSWDSVLLAIAFCENRPALLADISRQFVDAGIIKKNGRLEFQSQSAVQFVDQHNLADGINAKLSEWRRGIESARRKLQDLINEPNNKFPNSFSIWSRAVRGLFFFRYSFS